MASLRWRAPASRRFGRLPASCRACVETAAGSVSRPSVRPTVHDPVRRFPPPGPLGRVPRPRRYYQRTPTSRRPSRRASFSFAWRYHLVRPVRSLGDGHAPGPRLLFNAAVRAALSGGDDETSQVPGRPLPACPALRPRRNQPHQTVSARQWCLPLLSQRRLPRCLRISWLNHAACKAPCVRFAAGVAPEPRNTRFRLVGPPWPVGTPTRWVA